MSELMGGCSGLVELTLAWESGDLDPDSCPNSLCKFGLVTSFL